MPKRKFDQPKAHIRENGRWKSNPKYYRWYRKQGKNKELQEKYNRTRYNWSRYTLKDHKERGYKTLITKKELMRIAQKSKNCGICGKELDWNRKVCGDNSPSLDRTENSEEIRKDNIQIICLECNRTKGARTMKEFINYCQRIVDERSA